MVKGYSIKWIQDRLSLIWSSLCRKESAVRTYFWLFFLTAFPFFIAVAIIIGARHSYPFGLLVATYLFFLGFNLLGIYLLNNVLLRRIIITAYILLVILLGVYVLSKNITLLSTPIFGFIIISIVLIFIFRKYIDPQKLGKMLAFQQVIFIIPLTAGYLEYCKRIIIPLGALKALYIWLGIMALSWGASREEGGWLKEKGFYRGFSLFWFIFSIIGLLVTFGWILIANL